MTQQLIIDCDSAPVIPEGWTLESHQQGGMLEWAKPRARLYRPRWWDYPRPQHADIIKQMQDGSLGALNANVLDYLFEKQHLIPEEWGTQDKERSGAPYIYFLGTLYRCTRSGYMVARYIHRHWDGVWYQHYTPLFACFGGPLAVVAAEAALAPQG